MDDRDRRLLEAQARAQARIRWNNWSLLANLMLQDGCNEAAAVVLDYLFREVEAFDH